jgi:hypothetical protein
MIEKWRPWRAVSVSLKRANPGNLVEIANLSQMIMITCVLQERARLLPFRQSSGRRTIATHLANTLVQAPTAIGNALRENYGMFASIAALTFVATSHNPYVWKDCKTIPAHVK